MTRWTEIEVDFGEGEETVNFGKTEEFAAPDSLYNFKTLATIGPNSDGAEIETVGDCKFRTTSKETHVAVTINQDIAIFTADPFEFCGITCLPAPVAEQCWIEGIDDDILLVASNGILYFVAVHPSVKVLFKHTIYDGAPVINLSCFVKNEKAHIVIIGEKLIYFIQIPKFHKVLNDLRAGRFSELSKILGIVSKETQAQSQNGSWTGLIPSDHGPIEKSFVLDNRGCMMARNLVNLKSICLPSYQFNDEIKKVEPWSGTNYLVVLTTDGELSLYDTLTEMELLAIEIDDEKFGMVTDFQIISSGTRGTLQGGRLLLERRSDDNAKQLEIRDLSTLKVLYSAKVNAFSGLACPTVSSSPLNIFFLEELPTDSKVPSMRLRQIEESHPQTRLDTLLKKGKFREAELLAQQFGLDLKLVAVAEINHLVASLAEERGSSSEDFERLRARLSQLNAEPEFVVEAVLSSIGSLTSKKVWVLRLLAIGEAAAEELNRSLKKSQDLREKLASKRMRFHTFAIIQADIQANRKTLPGWLDFESPKLWIEALIYLIETGNADCAELLWVRHEAEIRTRLNKASEWNKIFDAISRSVTVSQSLPWERAEKLLLDHLVTAVFHDDPAGSGPLVGNCIFAICEWLEQKESTEHLGLWPKNALRLSQLPWTVVEAWWSTNGTLALKTPSQKSQATYAFSCLQMDSDTGPLGPLRILSKDLNELLSLHSSFDCKLSMAQFKRETTESVCYRILDRVQAPELLPKSLNQYARPYMKQRGLEQEATLYRYVSDVIETRTTSDALGDSSWEERAVTVIKCMRSAEYTHRAVLVVAKHAQLPWSKPVSDLVESALIKNHPWKKELETLKRLAQMRLILYKYNLSGNLSSYLRDPALLRRLITSRILESQDESRLPDAITVAELSQLVPKEDIYLAHFTKSLNNNQVEEILTVLRSLIPDVKVECATRLAIKVELMLEQEQFWGKSKNSLIEVGIALIQGFGLEEKFQRLLTTLLSLQALIRSYGINATYVEVKTKPENIMAKYCTDSSNLCPAQIKSLGYTLGLERGMVLKILWRSLYRNESRLNDLCLLVPTMLNNFRGALSRKETEDILYLLNSTVFRFLRAKIPFSRIVQFLQKVIPLVINTAHPEYLEKILKVRSYINLCVNFLDNCGESAGSRMSKMMSQDDELLRGMESGSGNMNPWKGGMLIPEESINKACEEFFNEKIYKTNGNGEASQNLDSLLQKYGHMWGSYLLLLSAQTPKDIPSEIDPKKYVETALYRSEKMLESVVKSSAPGTTDHVLALGLLLVLPQTTHFPILQKLKSKTPGDASRQMSLVVDVGVAAISMHRRKKVGGNDDALQVDGAENGQNLASIIGQQGEAYLNHSRAFRMATKWANRLRRYDVTFSCNSSQRDTEHSLDGFAAKSVPFRVAISFCRDFGLPTLTCLNAYISHLLTKSSTTHEEKSAVLSEVSYCVQAVKTQERDWKKLQHDFSRKLHELLDLLDPYNYEFIGEVLRLIIATGAEPVTGYPNSERLVILLDFLLAYRRRTPPSSAEKRWYSNLKSETIESNINLNLLGTETESTTANDEVSTASAEESAPRLPFHLLLPPTAANELVGGDARNRPHYTALLEPEFCLENFGLWLKFAESVSLLPITKSQILSAAITERIASAGQRIEIGEEAGKIELDRETTSKITEVLYEFSEAEIALKCCAKLIKELSFSRSKLDVVEGALRIVSKWAENSQSDTRKIEQYRESFVVAQQQLGTRMILRNHQLLSPLTLSLIATPDKIITTLYDSVLDRNMSDDNISRAVSKIAELCKLKLSEQQDAYIEARWPEVATVSRSRNLDMTLMETDTNFDTENDASESRNSFCDPALIRTVYVRRQKEPRKMALKLLSVLNSAVSVGRSKSSGKVQALFTIFRLYSPEKVSEFLSMTLEQLSTVLKEQMFVEQIEDFVPNCAFQQFQSVDKAGFVETLWRGHSKKVAEVVAFICIDYNVGTSRLYQELLSTAVATQKIDVATQLLLFIASKRSDLWLEPFVREAWKAVSDAKLREVAAHGESEDSGKNAVLFSLRCPYTDLTTCNAFQQSLEDAKMNRLASFYRSICKIIEISPPAESDALVVEGNIPRSQGEIKITVSRKRAYGKENSGD